MALGWFLRTPAAFRSSEALEQAMPGALHAVALAYKMAQGIDVVSNLSVAYLNRGEHELREVAIDAHQSLLLPNHFRMALPYAFEGRPAELAAAQAQGQEEGTKYVWEFIRDDKQLGLMRPRRDLAERVFEITPTFNYRGIICCVPTKIPDVFFRYFYGNNSSLPTMSIIIK